MPMLEKARASLPEPTKGPSKSASKPAAGKAQADSSSTASAGGAAASSTSSAPTDGNVTSRKPKSGTKPPAETKASGNKPDSDPSSPQEQMKEEMKGVKFSVYDMKFFETWFGPLWLSCVSHVAPKKDVLNLGLPKPAFSPSEMSEERIKERLMIMCRQFVYSAFPSDSDHCFLFCGIKRCNCL